MHAEEMPQGQQHQNPEALHTGQWIPCQKRLPLVIGQQLLFFAVVRWLKLEVCFMHDRDSINAVQEAQRT